jgi:adenine-specific DNA methylase
MVDDIEYHLIAKYKPIIYQPKDSELQEKLLEELQYIFAKNGVNISTYNLPQISAKYINNTNQLVKEELNYDIHSLEIEANKLYCQLNNDQNNVFHEIVTSVINKEFKFFFVCGHGGTGKTFL